MKTVAGRTMLAPAAIAILAGCTVLASVLGFNDALRELISRWDQQEQYSYGYLVPVVSAWLIWSQRHALRANLGSPTYWGVVLIMIALALGILGELSAIFILSQFAFALSLMGIVLAVGGAPLWRITAIPIAYLLFAIPLPYFLDAKLTLQLQLISSQLGVSFITFFQIPVYLDGNIIDLGNYKLEVVEACSGLRYLYPLLSLSFLAAYLFRAPVWQRAIVFLSSIPIAILMNGVRIGVVGLLVDHWGTEMAEGFLHAFEGWVIFAVCAAMLTAEAVVLTKLSGRSFADAVHLPNFARKSESNATTLPRLSAIPLFGCLALICGGGIAINLVSHRSEIAPSREQFAAFPMHFSGWTGKALSLDWSTEQALNLDDYIMADYHRSDGHPLNLYVAYYASQRKNESPHSPTVCLPGSGWIITDMQRRTFRLGGVDHPFNRVLIQKGSTRDLVYYWFEERGRGVADEYEAKWRLLVDSVLFDRTDGALVRLSTQVSGESDADADRRLSAFMEAALPELWSNFLPKSPLPYPLSEQLTARRD